MLQAALRVPFKILSIDRICVVLSLTNLNLLVSRIRKSSGQIDKDRMAIYFCRIVLQLFQEMAQFSTDGSSLWVFTNVSTFAADDVIL